MGEGVELFDLASMREGAELLKQISQALDDKLPRALKRTGDIAAATDDSMEALKLQVQLLTKEADKAEQGTAKAAAATNLLKKATEQLSTAQAARTKALSGGSADDVKKSLSASDLAKAVFSDDLVRRVENLGGVAIESSGKLGALGAVGTVAGGSLLALAGVALEVNAAIAAHEQELAAALAKTTQYTERVDLMKKAMAGSASSARELGVSVSDTATRQEVQTAILKNQSLAYLELGRSIDESIKAAAKKKAEQDEGSEGTKSLGLGIAKAAIGPVLDIVDAAGSGIGKLKTLSADYQREQEAKAQAAAYAQARVWEIEVAQTTEQLKQLGIARDKAAVDNQVLLQRLADMGVQSALGEKVLSLSEQLAAVDAQINEKRDRRGQLLTEEARASRAYADELENGMLATARTNAATMAEFQKDEVSRRTQLLAIGQQTNELEARRVELIAKQEREKDQTLQLKLQSDQLEYQLAQKGAVLDLGGQALSQEDRVAAVQARINELTDHGRKTWAELPAEIQKSVMALGGMLNTELDAVKAQQDAAKQQREAAKQKGEAAAQAERQRLAAQLELQIQNELAIAHNRLHNASIARLDISQRIHTTEAAILALHLSGERVRQRDLDKAKELQGVLDKLKTAQAELFEAATRDTIGTVTSRPAVALMAAIEASKKIKELQDGVALEAAVQLENATSRQAEGLALSAREMASLREREATLTRLSELQAGLQSAAADAAAEAQGTTTQEAKLAALQRELQLKQQLATVDDQKRKLAEQDREAALKNDFGGQMAKKLGASLSDTTTMAQRFSSVAVDAFNQLGEGFASNIVAVIQGQKSFGQAMTDMTRDFLAAMVKMAIVEVIKNTAQGLGNIAIMNYAGAAANFASAGVWAAIGGVAGIGLAAVSAASRPTTPAASNANSGSTPRAATQGAPQLNAGGGGGGFTLVQNITGALYDTGVARASADAIERARNTGVLPAYRARRAFG